MKRAFGLSIFILFSACSKNLLSASAGTQSNDALYYRALGALNQSDYSGALTTIGAMDSSYQISRKVVNLRASAYGGLCGINFLGFVQAFQGIGSTRLLPFLVQQYAGATPARLDACASALGLMSALTGRTNDENIFIAMIGLASMGNILDYYTDVAQNGQAGASVDVCQDSATQRPPGPGTGNFFDADLRQFGVAFTATLASFAAVAGQIALGSGSVAQVNAFCAELPTNFCAKTDPASFTTTDLKGLRTIMKEGASVGLGVNGCAGKDYTQCYCP